METLKDPIKKKLYAKGCTCAVMLGTDTMEDYVIYPSKMESSLYKEPYKTKVTQDDSTKKSETIDESAILTECVEAVRKGKKPPSALYFGGTRYPTVNWDHDKETGVTVIVATQASKGAVICSGKGESTRAILVTLFDTKQNQNARTCRLYASHFLTELMKDNL